MATLLGAPLSTSAAVISHCSELSLAIPWLQIIAKHDALTLLRGSFSSQRMLNTLQCRPSHGHLCRSAVFLCLTVSGSRLLPVVTSGGLGIRRPSSLALPAFLASVPLAHNLQSSLLNNNS